MILVRSFMNIVYFECSARRGQVLYYYCEMMLPQDF